MLSSSSSVSIKTKQNKPFQIVSGGCFKHDKSMSGTPIMFGKNKQIMKIKSVDECQQKCQDHPECVYFNWNSPQSKKNKNSCWLKKTIDKDKPSTGKISGPKNCPGIAGESNGMLNPYMCVYICTYQISNII